MTTYRTGTDPAQSPAPLGPSTEWLDDQEAPPTATMLRPPRRKASRVKAVAALAGVLLVVAVVNARMDDSVRQPPDVPAPPQQLVGQWNGGPGGSSDWYLTIREDGRYALVNEWLGWTDSGYVDTSGHGFRVYNGMSDSSVVDAAGISECDWSIERLAGMTFLYFCGQESSWTR